jgi:hypothetical protein
LVAAGLRSADSAAGAAYAAALREWLEALAHVRFGGVVCDYDDTVCPAGSGQVPLPPVRAAFVRLLQAGLVVGFASSGDRSLHQCVRDWVPREHWDRVLVGMCTGGARVWLSDEIPDSSEIRRSDISPAAAAGLAEAQARLAALPFDRLFVLDRRLGQLSVQPHPQRPVPVRTLLAVVAAVVGRPPMLAVRLAASADGVDIVPAAVSKASVVTAMTAVAGSAPVLAIGNRGQPGGSDFELLACVPHSLSVDRCSADPTRCWNLAPEGQTAPEALVGYLDLCVPP